MKNAEKIPLGGVVTGLIHRLKCQLIALFFGICE